MIPGFKPKDVPVRVLGDDAAAPTPSPATGAVLIVDEALPIRRKLEETLVRSGVPADRVHVTTSAREAQERFMAIRPGIVFMELVGDDPADGLELVYEMLREDPSLKIVLTTAEPEDSPLVRQAVRAGVFALVRKPLRHDQIRQVLQEISSEEGGIERMK